MSLSFFLFGLLSQACFSLPFSIPVHDDIVLTAEQKEYFFGKNNNPGSRTGLTDLDYRWPDRTLVYELEGFTERQEQFIERHTRALELITCIRFVRRTTETDYVWVTNVSGGCWSAVGRVGGPQQMNLNETECLTPHHIMHEFIHALGFFHMHSAYERDEYVQIMWENIYPGLEEVFEKVNPDTTSQFDVPYDYGSIMHYHGNAFSFNGEPTIVPLREGVRLERHNPLSKMDILRIQNMYCPNE